MGLPRTRIASLLALAGLAAVAIFACSGEEDPAQAPDPVTTNGPGAPADDPPAAPVPTSPGRFPDEASARGIDHVNRSGSAEKATILEANGAGVCVIDLGADGDLDLVFAQGLGSVGQLTRGPGADLDVFVNDGEGNFTRAKGPGLSGWWTGLATGDVDSDGDMDLVAAGFGRLVLLIQSDDGELVPFEGAGIEPTGTERLDVGAKREAGAPPSWPTSLALFDANADGHLDLYVGRYLDFDPVDPPLEALGEGALSLPCRWKGHTVFCGPRGLEPQGDLLYAGKGDGTFVDVTKEQLAASVPAYTLGVVAFDSNMDGLTDLYVANDSAPNQLLLNVGGGRFVDRGQMAGVALSQDGMPEAGMGTAVGDVNRDGMPDLTVTNFSQEPTALYFGGQQGFSNQTYRMGLQRETRDLLSWGVHLVDFDGDGWLELFTANGHVYPQADLEYTGTSYGQADTLFRLMPDAKGRFRAQRVTEYDESSILSPAIGTRGTAVGDLDGDRAPDLVLSRIDAAASLGMNRTAPSANRLVVRCIGAYDDPGPDGRATPRDGHGARIAVVLGEGEGDFALLGEVQTAQGYQSASAPEVYFGLGDRTSYTELRVFWPSGRQHVHPGGPANRTIVLREDRP